MGNARSVEENSTRTLPSDQDATGRSFGELELRYLSEVIESGTLFGPKGQFVNRLESEFARYLGVEFGVACSSGTAAIHATLAASDFEPGDEVITTGITDMGAIAPVLFQGLIPVFADVDPETGLVTADSISERVTDRTRAIVATHLFGNPCDMDSIVRLGRQHEALVIEDCAQAYGATIDGRLVGTFGDVACFSLQQGKHITAGEGGLVATSHRHLRERVRRFINKAWDYDSPTPDHDFLALNYRMSELAGAVALAQISRLEQTVKQRVASADVLTARISTIPGLRVVVANPGAAQSYWRFALLVDREIQGGPQALAATLRSLGVPSAPRYIQKPAFRCGVFANMKTFGASRYPFTLARPEALDYGEERYPGTFDFIDRVLVLPWNERMDEASAETVAEALRVAVGRSDRS